jgi:F-type H+-transporting ATPase subunit b
MAGNTVIVAQAEQPADALQEGVVVEEHAAEGAGTADGEHAVTDETQAEVGHETAIFPPFDATYFAGQLFWFAITFAILYWMISRVVVPRIGGILEQRRVRLEGDLKEADRLRQETDRAIAAYEAALAEARQRAHGIAEETRASIKADIEGKRAAVEADLGGTLAAAEQRIEATKSRALANVEEIAADTAAALVAALSETVTAAAARDAVKEAAKG